MHPPDPAWLGAALAAARPRALAALTRHFRDLDRAEEAFQEACLRAVRSWPENGPPRDPAAWLILVGRNAGTDALRRTRRETALPEEDALPAASMREAEADILDALEDADWRDDVLRLLFVCAHPGLAATAQVALALRVVAGLSVAEIARAFLVSDAAMEQRITRAKRQVAALDVPFEAPGPAERAERFAAVAACLYLVFNEGYSASGPERAARAPLMDEGIRLARLLLRLFPAEPEAMGLLALMLLQHARTPARFDEAGGIVLLDAQDRRLWRRDLIAEGLALVEKALRHGAPGPYQVQAAIAALHDRAATPAATDWREIALLYALLERLAPSPVVTLNRAVAVLEADGPVAALALIEPLADRLGGYFHFHGVRGALLKRLGRAGEARDALGRAIALARSPAEAQHIRHELDALEGA